MSLGKLSRSISLMLALLFAKWAVADVTSSSNPALVGQPVTFTVAITSPGVTAVPTGNVTFADNGQSLGTVSVQNGIAEFTTSFGTAGDHVIVAEYSGDANFQPATSPEFPEHVTADDVFTVAVSPSVINQTAGDSSSVKVTVFSNGGVANSVHLSCEDLPPGTTCSFQSDSLVPNASGNSTTMTVASTPAQAAAAHPVLPNVFFAVLFLPFLIRKRHRSFLTICLLSLMLLCGCGSHVHVLRGGTPAGAYTIHVVGSDAANTQQAVIQFNVK